MSCTHERYSEHWKILQRTLLRIHSFVSSSLQPREEFCIRRLLCRLCCRLSSDLHSRQLSHRQPLSYLVVSAMQSVLPIAVADEEFILLILLLVVRILQMFSFGSCKRVTRSTIFSSLSLCCHERICRIQTIGTTSNKDAIQYFFSLFGYHDSRGRSLTVVSVSHLSIGVPSTTFIASKIVVLLSE